ncbi:MAG TPA: PhnD/SsuA/transferrin family substrate-binding protein [Gemmataceae bacterium]|nr:PhnD/SsuA/transferrin family substrate-binding protein [Gemmataceae bacterium]
MPPRTLRFVSYLAPNMLPVYGFIARHVGARLGCPTELRAGGDYGELAHPPEVAFLCGLAYVEHARRGVAAVEPVAAPVLRGARYGGRPVYFSDVITRRDSPFRSFADLRGQSWSFNEPYSQSGYGITRHHLLRLGQTGGYFGRVVEAGFHERSIRLVRAGAVAASAVDSQVLAVALRDSPELAADLRVIDSLGPSPIQPVVMARRLPAALKEEVRAVLVNMADDPEARRRLAHGFVERFAPADDATYDPIRAMLAEAEAAGFLTLR